MLSNLKKKRGVLLINLGTPNAPTPTAVYRYLSQFLNDGRVIDLPWWKRQLLVRGLIVPLRFLSSTKAYQAIWTEQGSPLLVYGKQVQKALQARLADQATVELAMRYQVPSIEMGLKKLLEKPIDHLIVLPLFPHYASATTGSIFAELARQLSGYSHIPKITFMDQFGCHPAFIEAFKEVGIACHPHEYDHVLFSFHGLPLRQIQQHKETRFCYSSQCYATAVALAKALGLSPAQYTTTFQSRLGKDPWISPYTSDTIENLARRGHKKILVFCPSFVADCLETLYEIRMEYGELFHRAGGSELTLVPSLNDHPTWIKALEKIVLEQF